MNRPYGAVDVAANLKGAVPKATVQKILVALAEKGELVQKTYGMSIGRCLSKGVSVYLIINRKDHLFCGEPVSSGSRSSREAFFPGG